MNMNEYERDDDHDQLVFENEADFIPQRQRVQTFLQAGRQTDRQTDRRTEGQRNRQLGR